MARYRKSRPRRTATQKEVRQARELLLRSYHLSGKSPSRREVSNVLHSFGLKFGKSKGHRRYRRR